MLSAGPHSNAKDPSMATQSLDPKRLIFTGTASHRGRKVAVSPSNSDLSHLHYARILLDQELSRVSFENGERETALLCMKGACNVVVNGATHEIGLHDGIYVPRGSSIEVSTGS